MNIAWTTSWVVVLICLAEAAQSVTDKPAEPSTVPPTQSQSHADDYQQGVLYLRFGNAEAAETAFKRALAANPRSADALLGLADIAAHRGQSAAVESFIAQALKADPNSANAHLARGRLLIGQAKPQEAERELQTAARLAPRSAQAHIELGALYLTLLPAPEKAVAAYRRAIELEPARTDLVVAFGAALSGAGRVDDAVRVINTLARQHPTDVYPRQLLGVVLMRAQRYDEAADAFDQSLRIDPKLIPGHYGKAQALLGSGRNASAAEAFQQLVALDPASVGGWVGLGLARAQSGSPQAAQDAWLKALSIDPKSTDALNNLAFTAAERGVDLDRALDWARRAQSAHPDNASNPDLRDTFGWVLRARKEYPAAIREFEAALAQAPKRADIRYHLALTLLDAGRKDDGRLALNQAIEGADAQAAWLKDARARLQQLGTARP